MDVFFPLAIHDTDVHGVGVQVNATVELVLLVVNFIVSSPEQAGQSREPSRLRQLRAASYSANCNGLVRLLWQGHDEYQSHAPERPSGAFPAIHVAGGRPVMWVVSQQ